jgi:hypothetical protein
MSDNESPFIIYTTQRLKVLEIEIGGENALKALPDRQRNGSLNGVPRANVHELWLRENGRGVSIMMDSNGTRNTVFTYNSVEVPALDFAIGKGALDPGRKRCLFPGIQPTWFEASLTRC